MKKYNGDGTTQEVNIKLFTSDQLNGLTGDNGEEYCIFIKDKDNPLNSAWTWFNTLTEANEFRLTFLGRL